MLGVIVGYLHWCVHIVLPQQMTNKSTNPQNEWLLELQNSERP